MKNILLFIIFISLSINSFSQETKTIISKFDFDKSIEILKHAVQKRGMNIISEVPHSKAAEKVGLELLPTHLIVFGKPKVGTLLMQENPLIGFDLPLKILIIENANQVVKVIYSNPLFFKDKYFIKNEDLLIKMEKQMEKIVEVVQ